MTGMGMMMPMPPRRGRPEKPYEPPRRAWRAAALGAAVAAYALLSYLATRLDTRLGGFGDMIVTLLAGGLLFALIGAAAAGLVALLRRAPALWIGVVCGSSGAVFALLWLMGASRAALLVGSLLLVVPVALLFGAVGLAVDLGLRRRGVAVFGLVALVLVGAEAWWLTGPGPAAPAAAAGRAETAPPPIAAPSPAEPGSFEVRTLTYGSGDIRRPEYGERAALVTELVDAAPLLPMWTGPAGRLRSWYWGFGPEKLPVAGRVWYPAGEGPFPLVLIVHGGQAMTEPAETGYAYLGELLASRGYIVAAISDNFLAPSPWAGRLDGADAARAWLLLQHLEAWKRWNATVGTPFFRRVEMSSIALIGHSRGAGAAYLAAVFNELPYVPENGAVALGYHFKIKAVAAVAPADLPYAEAPELEGVSFLALQGAVDAVAAAGVDFYGRVRPAEAGLSFKAQVAVPGANHSQFSSLGGRRDWPDLAGLLLNTRAVMAPEQQRQIAGIYLSAFLDVALRENRTYLPLLRDPRAGAAWHPEVGNFIAQYADGSLKLVSDYGEDRDLLTTSAPGGVQRGEYLAVWREQPAGPGGADRAVFLAWAPGSEQVPAYTIALPDHLIQAWDLGNGKALTFALADVRSAGARLQPLDLTVELVAADGAAVSLPLSRWAAVPVPGARRLTRLGALEPLVAAGGSPSPVMQTFTLPLTDFAAGTGFDPARLRAVRFRFDRSPAGEILLDDVGFMRQP